ncbi:MAG: DUF2019 domain-containing protein [Alcaligenaceae bacterium]|jgi:hypothetical protein|nr:MAG: DUF2019 domain-containing protein [Alcaligenaceae bacterium]
MRRANLSQLSIVDLVERFAKITSAQDEASLGGRYAEYNRLYDHMIDICDELKSRDGDQRAHLIKLYSHQNMHVRLQAAKLTLAVAPQEARDQLQAIVASQWFPQAGDAGMCLRNLELGVFKPT